jgi:hypothetical protein
MNFSNESTFATANHAVLNFVNHWHQLFSTGLLRSEATVSGSARLQFSGGKTWVVPLLSVVPLKIGKITVTRGKRTGKRRLFAKSQYFTGRILLRTGTNTQEGDYPIL